MTRSEAVALLRAAGVPDPLGDTARLERGSDGADAFAEAIRRRAAREPVSHILGFREFWNGRFRVTPAVLDPRPETETLVALALEEPFARVLDLGTGSGAIIVSLLAERPEATGVGTDISPEAVLVAGENAAALGVADRLILPLSDWWADVGGRYDLIVSNPPYIAASEMAALAPEVRDHEPRGALTDEGDGLGAYRAIAEAVFAHLEPGGRLLLEIGPTQARSVAALVSEAGLIEIAVHPDIDGRDRVLAARRPA
ncbi:MAG: peptide chain release factor N(5)-glutamine methyltransferase [Paracoccaceae bacterium]|nr:peptide chain release factor N(5)-glutamine methyltransferase [Paracoccaceae bacterium]